MQIKHIGDDKYEVKSKDVTIILGHEIVVNNFVLPGPGEYEKSGVFVEGIPDNKNTIYVIKAEEINLCYLGKITHDLKENEVKEIGDTDILFVPLGKEETLGVKKSVALISKIDPKIAIPMYFNENELEEFKKSEGITDGETDVLKIKKSELPADERKNVILRS